jgi:hypothetical protein
MNVKTLKPINPSHPWQYISLYLLLLALFSLYPYPVDVSILFTFIFYLHFYPRYISILITSLSSYISSPCPVLPFIPSLGAN